MRTIDWDQELSVERRDALIEQLASKVVKHGMVMPSVLFLEMHKPFGFLAGQALILGSGFLVPFVGFQNIQEYSKLLESKDSIERLILRLEQLSSAAAGEPTT